MKRRIKRKTKLKPKSKAKRNPYDVPFMVAKRPKPKLKDGDTIPVSFTCPTCLTHWADAKVTFGADLRPEDFSMLKQFENRKVVDPGKPIACPACGWEYSIFAIEAAILAAMNRQKLESKMPDSKSIFGGASEH